MSFYKEKTQGGSNQSDHETSEKQIQTDNKRFIPDEELNGRQDHRKRDPYREVDRCQDKRQI
jgi:hypothetical protein